MHGESERSLLLRRCSSSSAEKPSETERPLFASCHYWEGQKGTDREPQAKMDRRKSSSPKRPKLFGVRVRPVTVERRIDLYVPTPDPKRLSLLVMRHQKATCSGFLMSTDSCETRRLHWESRAYRWSKADTETTIADHRVSSALRQFAASSQLDSSHPRRNIETSFALGRDQERNE